jgi:signal transduction histidine kinase
VNAVPLTGKAQGQTVCTFSEITELKQAESRLQASEAQFRELAQQEELLNTLSTQIRQSLDLQTILQTAVREVRQRFESDRALIYQFDPHWCGQVVLEDVSADWPSTLGEAADDCFPQACLDHYQSGGIRAIHNISEAGLDPAHLQFLQRLQVQANLIVPISVRAQLWGLLIVHQCTGPRMWQAAEGKLLSSLGVQLGIAIQQADLYTQAEQAARQAQAQAQELRASEAQLKQQAQTLQCTLDERQSLQLQLAQSEKMSSLGQLVAGVAHEINNPVNFIHGNLGHVQDYAHDLLDLVSLYQQQYPAPNNVIEAKMAAIDLEFLQIDLVKILKSMAVGTERIRQIVLSLRNFSRMDEAAFKTVDIHEGIDSTLMILQHRLKARPEHPGITVVRNYGTLPPVDCYPGQLNQVFMNILANAIDALAKPTASGQPSQITIRTAVVDRWVEIAIADNGSGIPEAVRQRIFDPFFTTKPIGKGTGMGLSISHQIIVEKHQGQLDCNASPEAGTEFLIQIPTRAESS